MKRWIVVACGPKIVEELRGLGDDQLSTHLVAEEVSDPVFHWWDSPCQLEVSTN